MNDVVQGDQLLNPKRERGASHIGEGAKYCSMTPAKRITQFPGIFESFFYYISYHPYLHFFQANPLQFVKMRVMVMM
jgi:hypothetical protein